MGNRPNCRSCRHCTPPVGMQMGWCQLRQLSIHAELVADLWCHHWTARPPRLPVVAPEGLPRPAIGPVGSQQLSLATGLS
ncbi:MAG: hypothetical protein QUV07_00695 [Cyanobium sp. CZS 25K]|nr:hypothetical protein [Cyanobium sp. CZS25K]